MSNMHSATNPSQEIEDLVHNNEPQVMQFVRDLFGDTMPAHLSRDEGFGNFSNDGGFGNFSNGGDSFSRSNFAPELTDCP